MQPVVHFRPHGLNFPAFSVGGLRKPTRTHSAERMVNPLMAGCHRIRQFAQEHHLKDRPHALLWLAKCYAIPASIYACLVRCTQIMNKGRV